MEATKNPKTDAQRDQYLALCRYIHDNIIFNYGSVENYIAAKNTEINTVESKLQSYYDNPRKGKSRRAAIIAGLENTIFIMKNSLTNTLRDLEELNAATPSERKIKYFHYTPEQLKRYIIDVYDKRADGEWVLDHQEDSDNGYYDVIDGKVIYWHDKRANRFSFYNMDFNSPTCGRCFQVNSTYQKEKYIVSNEILMEFLTGDFYRNIHKQTVYNNGKYEHYYSIQDRHGNFNVDDFAYTFDGIMQRFNDCYKDYATIIWQSSEFAPQSPETPQTVE